MDVSALAAVPLLSILEPARLERLARGCPARDIPAGGTVARVGDPARHLVVLESGTLSGRYDASDGTRIRFATVTAPCVVDKAAVLGGGTHTASWAAVSACRIRLFPADLLRDLIDEVPALRDHVLRHLSAQVNHDRRARVRSAASGPVARVADWITETSGMADRRIRLVGAQQGLGEELGLSRVSVNRALRTLSRAGAIRVEPATIIVLNPAAVAAFAAATP